ncbi:MAG TPA: ABC transporter ATP-binding protein [Casimicrobiaceae bacterium]|nr:ABC transporter ATP-binding protein [Casimicrobiaceae bacterium]
MTAPVLEVRGLGKAFVRYRSEWLRVATWFGAAARPVEASWVVRDVSFAIARGEAVGLIGRNGAGKSTLLKMIAGTLRPSAGTVQLNGRIAAILELGMGFNPEFTGRQNATHALGLMGFPQQEIDEALPRIEAFAEIGEYFDQPTRIYSSGMQMRVAFAVATAFVPDILLVDEALSVGDVSFQAKCFARIEAMRADGCALLYVSHSVEDVVKHCKRALFVDAGHLLADAPSRDVANAYLDHVWGARRAIVPVAASPAVPAGAMDGPGAGYESRPHYRTEEYRWGNGGARIADYYFEVDGEAFAAPVRARARFRIVMRVDFERDVDEPVYGLLIRTHDGVFLFGTNSRIASKTPVPPARKGGRADVEFVLPANLNSGAFLLSLGVSEPDPAGELVPLDRRYDSILIRVVHDNPVWGLVDLEARCRVVESPLHVAA